MFFVSLLHQLNLKQHMAISTIQLIKDSVKQVFGCSRNINTTLSYIVKLVKDRFPQTSEEQIKDAMADIEGWEASTLPGKDQIEITPLFFR